MKKTKRQQKQRKKSRVLSCSPEQLLLFFFFPKFFPFHPASIRAVRRLAYSNGSYSFSGFPAYMRDSEILLKFPVKVSGVWTLY
jgi:hypothetical protein